MAAAPFPADEVERLKALLNLSVLDTVAEPEFDALVQAAALVCDVPISLISLIDSDRQWFKANAGLPGATQTPRDQAFCAHAILGAEILEVADAHNDPRFFDNPLVTEDPKIRFYAGAPIRLSSGATVGTLCVIDTKPNQLDAKQKAILAQLAIAAAKALEGRKALLAEHNSCKTISETAIRLLNAEQKYRALTESSPIGIYSTDAQGLCTYTNKNWQTIFGLNSAESLGDGWCRGIHPDDAPIVFALWELNASSGHEFDMEFRTLHADGTVRNVHSIAKPIINQEGEITGFIGSVLDVTLAKQLARENTTLLSTIRTQFIMSITDVRGVIVDVNDAFCDISKYSRDRLIGSNHRIINSGTHGREYFAQMWADILQGNSWRGEICNRAADGELYWVDSVIAPLLNADGEIDRFVSIRIDITPRKIQEESLRKSRAMLDKTGRIAGVGGWEIDLISGDIYWSEETCRIHGVPDGYRPTLDEAINFYAPEARVMIERAVKKAMESAEGWDLELPFIQANGNRIWVRAAGSVEFAQGLPVRIVGIFQDITEQIHQRLEIDAAHNRIALATDSGQIGVWEYDLIDQELVWDAWMERLYGVSTDHTLQTLDDWIECVDPDDRPGVAQLFFQTAGVNDRFDMEFRILRSDGELRYIKGSGTVQRDNSGRAVKLVGVNWDVTPLRKLAEELAEQHELLRVTLKSIGDAVITTDAAGNTVWMNPVAERMTGWQTQEAKGRPLSQVFHIVNEETRLKTENPVATCLEQGKVVGLANHTVLISRNGDEFGIEDSAAPIRSADGALLGVVLVFHDVTEQRRLSGEVSYRATHDLLTGLVNRVEFETRLRRLLHTVHEDRSQHALMYIDLDQFKIVNDTCGHSVGDELLQQIAKILQVAIRTRDTLARLGGDEFGVILEYCSTEQAQRVAQDICERMENFRFLHDMHRFRIGTSIGLVPIDNRWANTSILMQAADTSCYAAKDAGRNRVHVWFDTDQAMRARHSETQWATRIENALDEDRFELYAQHIVDLNNTEADLHAEILVRMRDRDGTLVNPDAFIPAAERFHLASRIDRWVFRHAIKWLQQRPCAAPKIATLSINLSGQSVGDRSFVRQLIDILDEAGSDLCSKLCVEITETAAITNLADASFFIEQVHLLGVRVALDDFGAGSSSFGYLKNLSVDVLKIDGQFIKDLLVDPLDDVAVRCFVDVARVVGLKTVAEFVDSDGVLARVKALGIDYAQGYLLHQPQAIESALPGGAVPSLKIVCQ